MGQLRIPAGNSIPQTSHWAPLLTSGDSQSPEMQVFWGVTEKEGAVFVKETGGKVSLWRDWVGRGPEVTLRRRLLRLCCWFITGQGKGQWPRGAEVCSRWERLSFKSLRERRSWKRPCNFIHLGQRWRYFPLVQCKYFFLGKKKKGQKLKARNLKTCTTNSYMSQVI